MTREKFPCFPNEGAGLVIGERKCKDDKEGFDEVP